MRSISLQVKAGVTIYASTGRNGFNQPDRMSSLHFYKAVKGSLLKLLDKRYLFNVATYSLNVDPKYIYTYDYEPESSWTTYNQDLSGATYIQEEYVFTEECYFRICLKREDGADFSEDEANNISDILSFHTFEESYKEKPYFVEEVSRTAQAILEKKTENSLVLAVVTDTHYTVNGTWEDTAYNIRSVHKKAGFDAIIHLGDLTDGLLPSQMTREYAGKVIGDLTENQVPLYVILGNHDSNYFANNPTPLSDEEQFELYLKDTSSNTDSRRHYYYVDYAETSVRCIYLSSFDYREKVRYGYPVKELDWLRDTLESTPEGYSLVIFSHVPPLAVLHYWSDAIRNGEELITLLESYQTISGNKIMALIHGHNHADAVYRERAFPIISIGCSKLEYFTEKKPEGVTVAERTVNTVTQDLWDTMIITPSANRIDFVRFGAGEDRTVLC